ncbi:MAG: hypothetical protein ACLP8S_34030 [Solirubrobacteraceae bacterium]
MSSGERGLRAGVVACVVAAGAATLLLLATAGVSGAAPPGGSLLAFGDNYAGQLGSVTNNGSSAANPTPTAVTLPRESGTVTQIAAGSNFSLAVTSSGQLYGFGQNEYGQLGSATNNVGNIPNPIPTLVTLPEESGTVTQVAAGYDHSLAVTSSGQLYAFGENYHGQLGGATNNGTAAANPTPTLVTLPGGSGTVTQVAAGDDFSLVVTSTGELFAFGDNYYGQLGFGTNNGTNDANPSPTQVQLPGGSGTVTAVAVGNDFSLVVTSSGDLYGFGDNYYGQLGTATNDGINFANPTPTLVTLPGESGIVTAVAAGDDFSLVVTSGGQLYSFGTNYDGQLGSATSAGTSVPNPTPALVTLPGQSGIVTAVAAGDDFSLAVTSSGQLYAFGDGGEGQLGSATITGPDNPTPTLVALPAGSATAAQVAAGTGFSLVISSGSSGILPPSLVNRSEPTVVTISGPVGFVSQIRSCDPGNWSGNPTFAYQWLRNGNPIPGATSSGYLFTSADDGQQLSCRVTATNAGGQGVATSAAITVPASGLEGLPSSGYPLIPKAPPRLGRPVKTLFDPQLQGIEVTQGVQASQYSGFGGIVNAMFSYPFYAGDGLPYPSGPLGPGGLSAQYQGVTLVSGGPTYVRVFVADRVGAGLSTQPLAGVTVSLHVAVQTTGGFLKPPAALQPQLIYAPPTVGLGINFAVSERTNGEGGYVFTIPDGLWTYFNNAHGTSLTMTANLYAPETDTIGQCADPQCAENDTFTMTGIGPFLPPVPLIIQTVAMGPPGFRLAPFVSTFGPLRRMYPGGYGFIIRPPGGYTIDTSSVDGLHLATGPGGTTVVLDSNNNPTSVCGTPVPTTAALLDNCRSPLYLQLVNQWNGQHSGLPLGTTPGDRSTALYDLVLGVLTSHRSATPSTSALAALTGELQANGPLNPTDPATIAPDAFVDESRPVGAVSHEFGHELGLIHAGQNCPGLAGSGANEPWPPDNTGALQSYGFDVTSVRTPRTGNRPLYQFQVFPPSDFDVMSYCGSDSTRWLSAENWERTIQTLAAYDTQLQASLAAAAKARVQEETVRLAASAADSSVTVGVYGLITDGQATISAVGPLASSHIPTPTNAVGLSLRSIGASGGVLADTPISVAHIHVDGGNPTTATFIGEAPADVQTLQVLSSGTAIGSRTRPAHGPTVALTAPKPGTRAGSRGLKVSWRESEAGHEQLLASVDVSTDGGSTWNSVTEGLTGSSATIPADALPTSRRGRIRVRVSDGFAETAAVSGLLRFPGSPPTVTITSVIPGVVARSDRSVDVYGQALDETGRILEGKALRWYLGRKLLGTGTALSLSDLTPGRHLLRLEARGHTGRVGVASVAMRILAEAPAFIAVSAPASVPRSARSMLVTVEASEPATLRVGTRHFAVGVRPTRVRISLTRRAGVAGAELVLSAYGRTEHATVAVQRR